MMKLKVPLAALCLAASVCAFAQTNAPANPEVTEFQHLLSTGGNGVIGKAMTTFFQTNTPAAKYEAILPLANEVSQRESGKTYIFWFREKNPKIEGDYWVEVTVDDNSKKITLVRINGYLK